jgi:hypothetical protein
MAGVSVTVCLVNCGQQLNTAYVELVRLVPLVTPAHYRPRYISSLSLLIIRFLVVNSQSFITDQQLSPY